MMRFFLLLVLLVFLSVETCWGLIARRADDKDFEVVANPHAAKRQCDHSDSEDASSCAATSSMNLDAFLEPHYLITQVMPAQADTIQAMSHVKIMTVPVPTYHMKQPARLSSLELDFQLILAKELSSAGRAAIHVVEVDPQHARDSWFPGYYWSPLVMNVEEKGDQHVGWKFTKLETNDGVDASLLSSSSLSLPYFYALMIELKNPREQDVVARLSGFKAPGWMAQRIFS